MFTRSIQRLLRIATGCRLAGWLVMAAALPVSAGESPLRKQGLDYHLITRTEPRPIRAHVLKLDLSRSTLQLKMVVAPDPDGEGPGEAVLTDPLRLAEAPGVLAFINVNPWRGMPDARGKRDSRWHAGQAVDILGLARAAGVTRSPAVENGSAAIAIDENGRARVGKLPAGFVFSEGLNGFSAVAKDGKPLTTEEPAIHPRSAIGVSKDGSTLWLVVVDGRQQGFSEGMNLTELGALMAELGCWDAVNLDGGGSSVLGLVNDEDSLKIVSSPSDRSGPLVRIRPVPCILTVCTKEK